MSEGRSLIHPTAINLGARPVDFPGSGHFLVVSSFYVFELATLAHVKPATWYEQVALHAGPSVIPDSLTPLPRAEVVVLGRGAPFAGVSRAREARVAVGGSELELLLRRDRETHEAGAALGCEAACWEQDTNPSGRGGPGDDREPLVVDRADRENPLWLGPTPYDHPLRLANVPKMDVGDSLPGWPPGTSPDVLFDAHPKLRLDRIDPGDRIELEAIAGGEIRTSVPRYRITITSGHVNGEVRLERSRIHTLALLPSAGLGAMIWRAAIALGDDVMGTGVVALIAALEDADAPIREAEHWGRIAVDRWFEPEKALDDRPLLPPAMAQTIVLPWQIPPGGDSVSERYDQARSWMKNEMGLTGENPFEEKASEEAALSDQAIEATKGEEKPPEMRDAHEAADDVLALARERHAKAGFTERPAEDLEPRPRGAILGSEIRTRLAGPYRSPREQSLRRAMQSVSHEDGRSAEEVLGQMAEGRKLMPTPGLPWPIMPVEEALRFGAAVVDKLQEGPLPAHVDVAGATFSETRLAGRRLADLLAEKTEWTDVELFDCDLRGTSFAGARFERCRFEQCRLEDINLSGTRFTDCLFDSCSLAGIRASDIGMVAGLFLACTFDDVSLVDTTLERTRYSQCSWRGVRITDAFWLDTVFEDTSLDDVSFMDVDAPRWTFTNVSMHKTWFMNRGFPGSTLTNVTMDTCGLMNFYRLDECRFHSVRVRRTGFTNAVLSKVVFGPGCIFEECDLTGTMLVGATLDDVRFIRCQLVMTRWAETTARRAWFHGSLMRGVDFRDTELAEAVFTDADIAHAKMMPDKTIGADFRGTVRADSEEVV